MNTTTTNLLLIFGLVTLVALIAAGVAGTIVVRVALRPLGRVVATATRVSELELAKGEVSARRAGSGCRHRRPHTEVGQVGAALNRMLGHVEGALVARQASEDKVRQFVADASHELRTPLASIRGYSELTRRGGHELPDDVVRSLGRIESESIRMTSLVEDLLLLARLDAGRELVLGEVDLVPLVVRRGERRPRGRPRPRVAAATRRTTRSWSYRRPRAPASGRREPAGERPGAHAGRHPRHRLPLAVEGDDARASRSQDDGPGISPGLLPVLFERFARGDGSRSRATGSTGLGLAIVAAVVDAHDGDRERARAHRATRGSPCASRCACRPRPRSDDWMGTAP